jgi:hypothetical protein
MLAAGFAGFTEIEEDARGTVDALARNEGRPNQTKQSGVLCARFEIGCLSQS